MNLAAFRNGLSWHSSGQGHSLYSSQLVDLGLCLRFERSRGQDPDTAVAEFDGSRTTTEGDDPKPTEWPAK